MTAHRPGSDVVSDPDPSEMDDATVRMPHLPAVSEAESDEEFDPDSTLVREELESTVIRPRG